MSRTKAVERPGLNVLDPIAVAKASGLDPETGVIEAPVDPAPGSPFEMMPKFQGTIASILEDQKEPESDSIYLIDVRDIHGNMLFKYNAATGNIEIMQRSRPDGKGGKYPTMLYLVPVRELTSVGDRNIIANEPVKQFKVNGIVVDKY